MKNKAYGYTRVSGIGQVDGDGRDRQEEAIRGFAKDNGFEVTAMFFDAGVSGTRDETERPEFQTMVSEMLRNGVRTVIVEGLDRLAREYRVQETILIYMASKKISLRDARTGEDVTAAIMSDPMKKALVQIQGIFAELEKGLLVKKLGVARKRIRERTGKCEGRKKFSESNPTGYAEVIRVVSEMRPRVKWSDIADELNNKGYRTSAGKTFKSGNLQMIWKRRQG